MRLIVRSSDASRKFVRRASDEAADDATKNCAPRLDIYYVFDPDIFDERCVPCSAALAPDWVPPCGPVSQIPAQGHNP